MQRVERTFYYGGQAVIEGVMMRGRRAAAVAVRRPDGTIALRTEDLGGIYTSPIFQVPFVRGIAVLWETLSLGMRSLLYSSNVAAGEEDGEVGGGQVWLTVTVSLAVAAALFFVGPFAVAKLLSAFVESRWLVLIIEGLVRLAALVGYIAAIGLVPDIRRVFAYHGAEHKTINAYEAGAPLTPEGIRPFSTAHVRCGTGFLLTVMVISVFVFAAVGHPPLWLQALSRVVFIPAIASLGYEFIRFTAAYRHLAPVRWITRPNLALQSLTTREPDDDQIEVAATALRYVLAADGVPAPEPGPSLQTAPAYLTVEEPLE
ncbi:MAG TPA: DUF1385 domain-containing protein [Dehalococcoidia bacterium]